MIENHIRSKLNNFTTPLVAAREEELQSMYI